MTTDFNDIFAGLESAQADPDFQEEVQANGQPKEKAWADPHPGLTWGALSSEAIPVTPAYPTAIFTSAYRRNDHSLLPNIRKIAVVIDTDLKDMILALPALDAMRVTYPQAEISLVGLPWHAQFWQGRPGPIDRVIQLPLTSGKEEHSEIDAHHIGVQSAELSLKALVSEHFDLALQLGSQPSVELPSVRHLGARLTAGLLAHEGPSLDRSVPFAYYQLEVLRYLEAVSLVGAEPLSLEARLVVTQEDCAEIDHMEISASQRLVVLYPGGSDSRRRWPVEKFAAVSDLMVGSGARVVLVGLPEDAPLVEQTAAACMMPVDNLCGQLSLRGLAALFSQADVVVGNNSGLLQMAGAVGSATVGVFWCADLISTGPATRLRHRPAVSWQVECPVCEMNSTRSACGHLESFVADVPVAEVAASALDLAGLNEASAFTSFASVEME